MSVQQEFPPFFKHTLDDAWKDSIIPPLTQNIFWLAEPSTLRGNDCWFSSEINFDPDFTPRHRGSC